MRKLIIILVLAVSIKAKSQQVIIKPDTLAFAPGQVTVIVDNPNKQTISINNYAAMNSSAAVAAKASADVSGLTTQLATANARITALEAKVNALQTKVNGLKATSTTTTIIQ